MPNPLGTQTIAQTPALGEAKRRALNETRAQLVAGVMKFFDNDDTEQAIAGMLKDRQQALEAEMGRIAALVVSRGVDKAKEQGMEVPQSAIWTIPQADDAGGGMITTALDVQMDIAEAMGIAEPEQRQEIGEKALMFAVKEGMRNPALAEGASALGEIFSKQGAGTSNETQGAVSGLLSAVTASKEPMGGVTPPVGLPEESV